jgi:hypothetical protein
MALDVLQLPPHNFDHRVSDCAIWALAALTSRPYEDVLLEVAKEDPLGGKNGLHVTQIQRISGHLGVPLKLVRAPHWYKGKLYGREINFEEETGILSVWLLTEGKKKEGHVCVLKKGQIIESIGGVTVWDWEAYTNPTRCQVHGLLVPIT